MRTVVIDLEFCKVKKCNKEIAFPLREEIIEIGAIMLDDNMAEIRVFKSYIKPEYSVVSKRIENLTGISNELLEDKASFTKVFLEFYEWLGDDEYQIHSWSMTDYYQLKAEVSKKLDIEQYEKIFSDWVDDQREFSKEIGVDKELSLTCAVSAIDEKFDGKAHDALTDARNTAKIVTLLSDRSKFEKRMKPIKELFNSEPSEDTLGSLFPALFDGSWAV